MKLNIFFFQFKNFFRISRVTASQLIEMFEASEYYPSGLFQCKNAETHILAFLWYISVFYNIFFSLIIFFLYIFRYVGNKTTLRSVSERFNLAQSTLFAMNDRVMDFLFSVAPNVIKFPSSEQDKHDLAAEFEEVRVTNI